MLTYAMADLQMCRACLTLKPKDVRLQRQGPGTEPNATWRFPRAGPGSRYASGSSPTSRSFGHGPQRQRRVLVAVAGERGEAGRDIAASSIVASSHSSR
jgi:hypothetical protein